MNLNKLQLAGRLTRDPDVRYTPKGTAVADIGLAINRRTKVNDEWKDETTFVHVTLWGRTAELAGQYLAKGKAVYVEGRLQLDSWEDKQTGQKRSKLLLVGESMQFIGSSGSSNQGSNYTESQDATPNQSNHDDDIPF